MSTKTMDVLAEVLSERAKQDAKWGEQSHPDGTSSGPAHQRIAAVAKATCDAKAKAGILTWKDILEEEAFEAYAEDTPAALRIELIQVAAVAVAWIEALDRRWQR